MFQKLTEFIWPDRRPPRVCEACDQPFMCGASLKGCWCVGVKLDAPTRTELRKQFKDCLCPACLERFARSFAERKPDEN
jgi:hypothetical protein